MLVSFVECWFGYVLSLFFVIALSLLTFVTGCIYFTYSEAYV